MLAPDGVDRVRAVTPGRRRLRSSGEHIANARRRLPWRRTGSVMGAAPREHALAYTRCPVLPGCSHGPRAQTQPGPNPCQKRLYASQE